MSKMSLDKVVNGKLERPPRIVLFGPDGIGKSTFAAGARDPIFLGSEDGTAQLDVYRFAEPSTWEDCLESVNTLINDEHKFGTYVVDTVDWAEPLCWAFVCERDSKTDIEAYNYYKGYMTAMDQWRIFLLKLDELRHKKNMQIILLGHSQVKLFKNPCGDDYDRYQMKMNSKTADLMREWADCVLFANYETFTREASGRVKGIDNGARVIYTERRAAYDAKNRYGLPVKMPLSWDEFSAALSKHVDQTTVIEELMGQLDDKTKKVAEGILERAGTDVDKRAILVNWLKGKIAA